MKTKAIVLVLSGAAALSSCGREQTPFSSTGRRDAYKSQADCMKDWGNNCATGVAAQAENTSHGGTVVPMPYPFYGPMYGGASGVGRSAFVGDSQVVARGMNAVGHASVAGHAGSSAVAGAVAAHGFGAAGRAAAVSGFGG